MNDEGEREGAFWVDVLFGIEDPFSDFSGGRLVDAIRISGQDIHVVTHGGKPGLVTIHYGLFATYP